MLFGERSAEALEHDSGTSSTRKIFQSQPWVKYPQIRFCVIIVHPRNLIFFHIKSASPKQDYIDIKILSVIQEIV